MESTTFSILLNGHPTHWFNSFRWIRQGDPLSPFLFIIVSQNLITILNHAGNIILIPIFYGNLRYHLMYADDLILISNALRSIAQNINFC